jgi:hypothetical protein
VAQGANLAINVLAGQLAQTSFQLGTSGADDLMIRASDSINWSAWKLFHVSAPSNQAPVVSAVDLQAPHGQSLLAASSLFAAGDADHDVRASDGTDWGAWKEFHLV